MQRLTAFLIFLACCSIQAQSSGDYYDLVLVDLQGNKQVIGQLPTSVFAPRVSPDGRLVAYDISERSEDGSQFIGSRIWIAELDDLDDRYVLPLYNGNNNWAPVWTPDGEYIVFVATTDAGDSMWQQRADGTGGGEKLLDVRGAETWAADGRVLTYLTLAVGETRDYGISLYNFDTQKSQVLVDVKDSEQHSSVVAPNGNHIAYISDETGRYEIWLTSLAEKDKRTQLTTVGGSQALWGKDGSTLYFNRDNQLYRISVDLEAGTASEPEALPIKGYRQGRYRRLFELMPDGKHFLMLYPQ